MLVIVGIAVFQLYGAGKTFTDTKKPTLNAIELANCKVQQGLDPLTGGKNLPDADKDGYPDVCDPCVGGRIDADGDGIQDACQPPVRKREPGASQQEQCEHEDVVGNWKEETNQCVLSRYDTQQ